MSSASAPSEEHGIKLVFLGRLEDAAGASELMVPLTPSVGELLAALGPELAGTLQGPRVKVARNGVLLSDTDAPVLRSGDEIAFLPPVSGG